MKNILFLLRREFGLFWSNKIFVFAFLIMPPIIASIFGLVYRQGRIKNQAIVIVDKDNSPTSNRFRDMMQDHPVLNIIDIKYETIDLEQTLLDERAIAVVVIPYRFEANILTQRNPEVNVYLNQSNSITSGAVNQAVNACAGAMNAGILATSLQKKGIPPASAIQQYESFKHNVFLQYNRAGNYLYFLWPGLIFSTLQQLLLLAMAVSFSREFAANCFTKAGILGYSQSPVILLMVKVLPYLVLSCFTFANYYLLSIHFQIPLPEEPGLLFLSQVLLVLGTCLLGTLYSIMIPIPLKASQMLLSVATPAFTVSGFSWPSEQGPAFLAAFGQIIPLTPFLKTIRMTLLQGATFQDVMPQIQHQLVLITVYLLLNLILLKVKINIELRKDPLLPGMLPA
ncbi:ABC transporter permease [Dyadobacter frigoris]|uniref:ABC transporter permease n=1 Tax=Dyadobacter frigoris TaxID=2576211 RepID=UPI0024A42EF3|nr:ABC transporter permease [Dyadobacter frigoris]GLU55177.1 ABC transporter permease [Dyadobacter frigoris]